MDVVCYLSPLFFQLFLYVMNVERINGLEKTITPFCNSTLKLAGTLAASYSESFLKQQVRSL